MGSLFGFGGYFSFAFGFFVKATDCSNNHLFGCVIRGLLGFFEMMANISSTAKFKIEKFNGKNDFSLWHIKMCPLLVQQGL